MRGRPGYLRVFAGVVRHMSAWAAGRTAFPWILIGAPLAAWLLPGQAAAPLLPLLCSFAAYCGPAAFLAGWQRSQERASLAGILFRTRAGRYSMIIPEMMLPLLAGAVPSVLLALLWSAGGRTLPWQVWTVIPFSSLTAVSLVIVLEKHLRETGHALNLLAFSAQASAASWASSGAFQLLVPHGYVLWTLRWAEDAGAAFHGDIYTFFSVILGIGLAIPAVRILAENGPDRESSP